MQTTSGPWSLRRSTRFGYLFVEHEEGGEACTLTRLECDEGDARLIAAAPELLEALERLLAYTRGRESWPAVKAAEAAVAKAKGLSGA